VAVGDLDYAHTTDRRQQLHHTGRVRSRLLPSDSARPRDGHPI